MYSVFEYSVPENVGELRDFNDIFLGVVKDYVRKSTYINPTHAHVVPIAADFFRRMIPEDENPIEILENSFRTQSPFIPGTSLLSIPVDGDMCNQIYMRDRKDDWDRAHDTTMFFKMGNVEEGIKGTDWARIFGQIPSAALIVAEERGFNPVIRVPSFNGKFPNYFNNLVLNYMPEGLEVGIIFIDGDVGEYCGKHSNGGRVVVNGRAGQRLGDCSKNVEYIVRNNAGKPTQADDCDFYTSLKFQGRDFGDYLRGHEAEELEEKGCNINEWVNFKKGALEKNPSGALEEMLTLSEVNPSDL